MIINRTLNDITQTQLLKRLNNTSLLLSELSTQLSLTQKEATIIAMPDLGFPQNNTRTIGGFFTGACYSWNSDEPFIPVDSTVNSCGVIVVRLKEHINPSEFKSRLNSILNSRESYLEYIKEGLPHQVSSIIEMSSPLDYFWNYNVGNHFITLAEQKDSSSTIPQGQYMIAHASALEFKKGNYGLYPNPGNFFYDDIKTIANNDGYLRYIVGEKAIQFYQLAHQLDIINKYRNSFFCKKVLGDLAGEEILNISHYGMPTNQSVCIGCHWTPELYPLLTSPGKNIFFIQPDLNNSDFVTVNNKELLLSPHGCGTRIPINTSLSFSKDSFTLDDKKFYPGSKLFIGSDVIVRTSGMNNNGLMQHVNSILEQCHGTIVASLEQQYARTKDGEFFYDEKNELYL